jgi:signal transduction histidine kinase
MTKTEQIALEKEVRQLRDVITGLEHTSKMLVRRDLDLRRAYDELKTVDTERTEFVSIAAHQLRTPVTTARWAVKLLVGQSDTTTTPEASSAMRLVTATYRNVTRKTSTW